MSTDLETTIGDAAQGPAEVSGDAGTVKQQPLSELIKADQYLAAKGAATKKTRGLRFTKLLKGGQTGNIDTATGVT